jgi:hypothetical protein
LWPIIALNVRPTGEQYHPDEKIGVVVFGVPARNTENEAQPEIFKPRKVTLRELCVVQHGIQKRDRNILLVISGLVEVGYGSPGSVMSDGELLPEREAEMVVSMFFFPAEKAGG